jgi:hypothetical protein
VTRAIKSDRFHPSFTFFLVIPNCSLKSFQVTTIQSTPTTSHKSHLHTRHFSKKQHSKCTPTLPLTVSSSSLLPTRFPLTQPTSSLCCRRLSRGQTLAPLSRLWLTPLPPKRALTGFPSRTAPIAHRLPRLRIPQTAFYSWATLVDDSLSDSITFDSPSFFMSDRCISFNNGSGYSLTPPGSTPNTPIKELEVIDHLDKRRESNWGVLGAIRSGP